MTKVNKLPKSDLVHLSLPRWELSRALGAIRCSRKIKKHSLYLLLLPLLL